MIIYINNQHEIRAIGSTDNPDLIRIDTAADMESEAGAFDTMMRGKCEAYILGFKYHIIKDDKDNIVGLEVTPYKSYDLLEAVQAQYEADTKRMEESQTEQDEMILENNYNLLLLQEGITDII